jgi:transposase-like protein
MGRRTRFTPDVRAAILAALEAGAYLDEAAAVAGVSVRTVHYWLSAGRDAADAEDEGRPVDADAAERLHFLRAVDAARAKTEVAMLRVVQDAAERGDWRAAAWYLAHAFPARWSDRKPGSIGVPEQQPFPTDPAGFDAHVAEVIAELERRVPHAAA